MEPILSVVIPIYNVEDYLERCIDSVLNQNVDEIEIILVDDGSPDKCPQICDSYATKFSNIKVVHKKKCRIICCKKYRNRVSDRQIYYFLRQ